MRRAVLALVSIGVAVAAPARAQLIDLNGALDVSRVETEIDGVDQENIQQRYTINASREITEAISARASFRYYKFDVDGAEQLGVFREEIQPTGELTWTHDLFHASSTAFRRRVDVPGTAGDLITDSFAAEWRSRVQQWPILLLRYDWQKIRNDADDMGRDTRDARFVSSLNYDRDHESIQYSFSRRRSENLLRDLSTLEYAHNLRFLGSHDLDDARTWKLDSQYLFTRRSATSEVRTGTTILQRIETSQGLFAIDPAPSTGTLDPLPGLVDGNSGAGTLPEVEIGAGSIDRNVGADLGFDRDAIAAMFLYVDRFSSSDVTWSVYASDDNLTWDLVTASPIRRFNPALLRYEIEFPPLRTRYVKVVNAGNNDVANVVVTEIEVYEALQGTDEIEVETNSHLITSTLRWRASDRVDVTAEGSMRFEPQQGATADREVYDYGLRSRWRRTRNTQWVGRWSQSWQRFPNSRGSIRDDLLSGTFLYDPLPTLGSTMSASWRQATEGGETLRTVRSAFAEVNAEPLPTIDVSVEAIVSRLDEFRGRDTDQWSLRGTLDTDITDGLNVLGSWSHQEITTHPTEDFLVRRTWTASVDLQITGQIFARAGMQWVEDQRFSRRQDYLINWTLGPRMILTGQIILDDASGGFRTDRASANATFKVNSRTTVYVRYGEIEQGVEDVERTLSWQQGLRMSF